MSGKKIFKVLVVDDEEDIVDLLSYNLKQSGYDVSTALDGVKAVEIAKEVLPDLILLDIMMPEQDGVETCRRLRQVPGLTNAFIIFLTARAEEYSEIAAFDVGADDYITKPIKPRALMSRIQALFRRQNKSNQEGLVTVNELIIDRSSYTVKNKDREIALPKKEFDLLYFLAQHPKKVYTREELLQWIWGTDVYVVARTVDVHIRKIREKIGDHYITTVKGVGYKFDLE